MNGTCTPPRSRDRVRASGTTPIAVAAARAD